eukprot:COSAG01_NODE_57732_length_310_cov_1.028436_1_plen_36_part_10
MLRVRAFRWILPKSADLCVSQFKEHQKDLGLNLSTM